MQNITLSITQLNTIVKRIIDAEDFISNVSVFGEVSNFKISGNNAYFDIKEEGAQLSCVMFGAYGKMQKNGDKVLVTGKLNYSIKLGRLSFIANKIEPYGMGELYQKYLELKEKLTAEGVFDERYKKQIPKFAHKIGVVTSETGAVIRDIYNVTKRKNPNTELIVYPAKVQGINAENEIVDGLKYFENTDVDIVIVARGGGSFEDLAPFNTEKVVRAVFECKKPIITGVGHETDFSLIDFVADMRAPTPSVAAELAVFDFYAETNNITNTITRIENAIAAIITAKKNQVVSVAGYAVNAMEKLSLNQKIKLSDLLKTIEKSFDANFAKEKSKLDLLSLRLSKANPLELLKQGYSRTYKDGEVIKSVKSVRAGETIETKLIDGTIISEVKSIKE